MVMGQPRKRQGVIPSQHAYTLLAAIMISFPGHPIGSTKSFIYNMGGKTLRGTTIFIYMTTEKMNHWTLDVLSKALVRHIKQDGPLKSSLLSTLPRVPDMAAHHTFIQA